MILLLLITGCNFVGKQSDIRQLESVAGVDSLFVPTGNAKLDSLLQLAAVAPQDTVLAQLYYQIGDLYENSEPERAKEYYLKLNDLSEQLDWNEGRWQFASAFAILLGREGLLDSALVVLAPALELAKKENNEAWIAYLYINTGAVYSGKEWYETALSYFMEAMPLIERTNDAKKLGGLYQKIGGVYININVFEKDVGNKRKRRANVFLP